MSALSRKIRQHDFRRAHTFSLSLFLFLLARIPGVHAQNSAEKAAHRESIQQEQPGSEALRSLRELLAEAAANNPEIRAAHQGWEAAKQIPSQISTRPDPQVVVQHLSVGSPRPFAGFTNSDFAYIGLGFSQDLPYPGKLRLRGDLAKRDADVAQQQYESVRRSVLAGVKSAYFQIAYLAQTLGILESDGQL